MSKKNAVPAERHNKRKRDKTIKEEIRKQSVRTRQQQKRRGETENTLKNNEHTHSETVKETDITNAKKRAVGNDLHTRSHDTPTLRKRERERGGQLCLCPSEKKSKRGKTNTATAHAKHI